MPSLFLLRRALPTILLVLLSGRMPIDGADKKEQIVHLTMANVQKSLDAFTNFGELLTSDPALAKQFKKISKEVSDKDDAGDQALALSIDKLQRADPRVNATFTKAGTTAGEASPVMINLLGAALGDAMLPAGKPIPNDMDPALAENLKFYRQHKSELAATFAKFKKLNDQLSGSDN